MESDYAAKAGAVPPGSPLILFIPGKNPKPEADAHREQLWRCLREGVYRARRAESDLVGAHPEWFEILPWTEVFYGQSRDIADELPWVDRLLDLPGPERQDIREAHAWKTRFAWLLYSLGDRIPLLIPLIANPAIRSTLEETRRYFRNLQGIGSDIRHMLQKRLLSACAEERPVLIIGHSMGSIIAYDTLWELTHVHKARHEVSLFLTLGSPLGLSFVQSRLLGAGEAGIRRYPAGIRRWINISAMGELTALDREFADDFHAMQTLGLVDHISDFHKGVYNYYRDEAGLNVHRSYGYLVNPVTGRVIADWIRSLSGQARRTGTPAAQP